MQIPGNLYFNPHIFSDEPNIWGLLNGYRSFFLFKKRFARYLRIGSSYNFRQV